MIIIIGVSLSKYELHQTVHQSAKPIKVASKQDHRAFINVARVPAGLVWIHKNMNKSNADICYQHLYTVLACSYQPKCIIYSMLAYITKHR